MKKAFIAVLLVIALAGCSPLDVAKAALGGGPKVAANVQAGKTNTQTIGTTKATEQKIVRPQARKIENNGTVTHNNVDPLTLLLLVFFAGLVIPSPAQIGGWVSRKFSHRQSK